MNLFKPFTKKDTEESKEEFLVLAAHELRTPLIAIRDSSDMLLTASDKLSDEDKTEMLENIKFASTHLISMVNDFLQTSRLEHGKINSKKEIFDISTVVESVLHQMKATAEKKNISLRYTPDASLNKVSADENYTEQIITNLVGNAIKFTEHGSIEISAREDAGFIKVSVHDSGIGISEQNKTLLFGKFQKVSENILARDVLQGSGLGLYICKMLAVNMGGDIFLEKSVVGEGSTFAFRVPKAS